MSPAIPKSMKCVEIAEFGGPEQLRFAERPVPQPKAEEVLIRVAAAGVNRPDVLQRMGLYPPIEGASDIPGLEASGEVVAVGSAVTRFKTGDQILALLTGGGYAQYATAHEGSCWPIPNGLSLQMAAGVPETFMTVWANVFDDAGLKEGETLLVHGGTSGIGVTAIAMAKAIGARVFSSAGSDEKVKMVNALGADLAFNYKNDSWEDLVLKTGGADVVLDMTGGDFVPRNLNCLNTGGRHVSIAFLRGMEATVSIFEIMKKRLRLSGSTMKARSFEDKARLARGLERRFWSLFETGDIKPVLDRILPLENASEAHQRMESGVHFGKIILEVPH